MKVSPDSTRDTWICRTLNTSISYSMFSSYRRLLWMRGRRKGYWHFCLLKMLRKEKHEHGWITNKSKSWDFLDFPLLKGPVMVDSEFPMKNFSRKLKYSVRSSAVTWLDPVACSALFFVALLGFFGSRTSWSIEGGIVTIKGGSIDCFVDFSESVFECSNWSSSKSDLIWFCLKRFM